MFLIDVQKQATALRRRLDVGPCSVRFLSADQRTPLCSSETPLSICAYRMAVLQRSYRSSNGAAFATPSTRITLSRVSSSARIFNKSFSDKGCTFVRLRYMVIPSIRSIIYLGVRSTLRWALLGRYPVFSSFLLGIYPKSLGRTSEIIRPQVWLKDSSTTLS